MGKPSPGVRSGDIVYNGRAPVVWNGALQTGATTASASSGEFIAPFAFNLREILWNISDGLSSTAAVVSFRRNGTVVASLSVNGLATGLVDLKPGATTTFSATDYLVNKGDRLKFTIPALASLGGQGMIVGAQ